MLSQRKASQRRLATATNIHHAALRYRSLPESCLSLLAYTARPYGNYSPP